MLPPSPEFFTCRLTVAAACSSPHLFQRVAKKPASLPAATLPASVAERVYKTYAAAAYPDEVTCLFKVRKADAQRVTGLALPAGCFVAPHGANTSSVQWLARPSELPNQEYLALAQEAVLKHSGACLAYRPGGRANLGVRTSTAAAALVDGLAFKTSLP